MFVVVYWEEGFTDTARRRQEVGLERVQFKEPCLTLYDMFSGDYKYFQFTIIQKLPLQCRLVYLRRTGRLLSDRTGGAMGGGTCLQTPSKPKKKKKYISNPSNSINSSRPGEGRGDPGR